jgi:predicted permease
MFFKILPLLLLIATGTLAGAVGLFGDRQRAITVLNRYALYIAFPALIVAGLGDPSLQPPDGIGFYLVHILGFIVVTGVAWVTGSLGALRGQRGTIVLCTIFGNIAYFGIPFCQRFLGDAAAGMASLSAAIHVAMAMLLGPLLFLLGNKKSARQSQNPVLAVLKQPLVWSPVVGLATRFLDGPVQQYWLDLTDTIGGSAGPVALFMLGLYLWHNRRAVFGFDRHSMAILILKLAVYPLVVWGLVLGLQSTVELGSIEAQVAILMAGMPVAVTTFSISEEFQHGQKTTAGVILVTTVVSIFTLPLIAAL